ncbi:hypothetical protein DFH07DRAFT_2848 [Mycena maculata]|uniref:RING-type domain-containing protein n=1 Tax=Mycena maculata TaxID=230809 RepID=A0AAD7P2H4_9AGAR|nr:hypothetical protein DFH07DRAFT_2848 [Mycena maculata]
MRGILSFIYPQRRRFAHGTASQIIALDKTLPIKSCIPSHTHQQSPHRMAQLSSYGDAEFVWEEEYDYGNETEQNECGYEEHFQRGDEDDLCQGDTWDDDDVSEGDAWEDEADERDYSWDNEEGGGWGEDTEVNGYASEPDPPNLCCTICLDTVCRPVVTLCLHIFCDECIYNVLRNGSRACPLCRATITEPPEPDTILDRYLERMISDSAVARPSGGRSSPYTWRDVDFSQH